MKISKKATSIVEAMVVMMIIVSGVTGMYSIYTQSTKLSNSITNKIQAIQIAKQGIEAFTNIRDTNWLLFSSNYKNCWNTLNYDSTCIGNSATTNKITGNYIIYRNNSKWELKIKTTTDTFGTGTYINYFRVGLNSDGIYTQTGVIANSLKPVFTREIKISYPDTNKMKVTSLVQWVDSSSTSVHKVEFEQILSNWKK